MIFRKSLFEAKKVYIKQHNLEYENGNSKYKFGLNQFSDWVNNSLKTITLKNKNIIKYKEF